MSHVPSFLSGPVFTLAFAGCSPTGINTTNAAASPDIVAQPDRPQYRKNPRPKQPYRITMKLEDAPGSFAQMLGLAQRPTRTAAFITPLVPNPSSIGTELL